MNEENVNNENKVPVVAIIGRPNVGKSTLFNRLLGKRRAITSPVPGVTRDAIAERWLLGNNPVTLIDSGGVKVERDGMDALVSERSLSLLRESDAILFMMDCTEVTGEDRELIEMLRPHTDKVVLVVNKIDDEKRRDLLWDFYGFGYQRVVGISAAHGEGISALEDTLLGILSLSSLSEAREEEPHVRLSLMGKPNTGKSTLTNLLVGDDISLVSDIPGTTRDVVRSMFTYRDTKFEVLDTAGIRRKGKVEEDVEYYSVNRAIKSIDEADVVLLMIDSVEGLSEQDKKIAALVVRRGKGIVLVLNKIDLLSGTPNELNAIRDRVRFLFPVLSFAPIVAISARNGENIASLLDTVRSVWKQNTRRVDTSALNAAVKVWGEKYRIPRGSVGYYKVYYGTQVGINPARFLFFVNHTGGFPAVYVQYLKNCIRRDLGFSMVPLEVMLRERVRTPSLHARSEEAPAKRAAGAKAPAKRNTGGRAVARPKPVKPGNKAALGKAIKQKARQNKATGTRRAKQG